MNTQLAKYVFPIERPDAIDLRPAAAVFIRDLIATLRREAINSQLSPDAFGGMLTAVEATVQSHVNAATAHTIAIRHDGGRRWRVTLYDAQGNQLTSWLDYAGNDSDRPANSIPELSARRSAEASNIARRLAGFLGVELGTAYVFTEPVDVEGGSP